MDRMRKYRKGTCLNKCDALQNLVILPLAPSFIPLWLDFLGSNMLLSGCPIIRIFPFIYNFTFMVFHILPQ